MLCFSAITKYYYIQTTQPDFLSDQHITAYIQQYTQDIKTPVETRDLINYCESTDGNYIIYKDFLISFGKAVYLNGSTSFEPEIIEGRSFTMEDFEMQTPTALIAESLNDKCILRDGKEFFIHDNNEYQVIGKFRRSHYGGQDKYSATYFVNMAAYFETNLDTPLNGDYTIDAKDKSREFLKGFTALAEKINPDIRIDAKEVIISNKTQKLLRAIKSSISLLIIFVLAAFLILLNISNITDYWINGRKKEIAIRMLSGGKPSTIRWMMLRDYLLIATAGYGIGLLLGIAALHLETFSFIGKTIYPTAVIVGYGTCLSIGAVAGFISLTTRLKQNIILQMKG